MTIQEPTLLFFRHRPEGWQTNTLIASSMQSLESSFFLIALGRYPHALAVCASAIESGLQAANIDAKDRDGFQHLVKKAKKSRLQSSHSATSFSTLFAKHGIASPIVDSVLRTIASR